MNEGMTKKNEQTIESHNQSIYVANENWEREREHQTASHHHRVKVNRSVKHGL